MLVGYRYPDVAASKRTATGTDPVFDLTAVSVIARIPSCAARPDVILVELNFVS